MADFHQEGIITTLHSLYEAFDQDEYLEGLEKKLVDYASHLNICLLLPCLYSELQNPQVLDPIVNDISQVEYLHSIVVALGGADYAQFQEARRYFSKLQTDTRDLKIVWVDVPGVQEILNRIREKDIATGVAGKGQSAWVALGYILGHEQADVIALHDCDIVTYNRLLLGRLIEPVANPNNDFEFCKGYYARISPSERAMKGRVTRLFVVPFVDAMMKIMRERGFNELENFFQYHRSFNYPLAGEFSFTSYLARGLNIAYDWGLEVSTLSEVYNKVITKKIAQVDLARNYEHKHQEMSQADAQRGLHRMVVDIAKFYLNYMRSHGFVLDDATIDMILHTYYQNALAFIKSYSDDAEVNNLIYDRYSEEQAAHFFRGFLWTAWEQSKGPQLSTQIPSWNRVLYTLPDIYDHVKYVVEKDNSEGE
ncbi:MAG: glycosyl transferase [Deltaproteobacteria bacterium]|jgi:glucosyl-3-phosphoglycerate synthase|nr:glycosyl transferase [Deltaproteobacteria bacterium]